MTQEMKTFESRLCGRERAQKASKSRPLAGLTSANSCSQRLFEISADRVAVHVFVVVGCQTSLGSIWSIERCCWEARSAGTPTAGDNSDQGFARGFKDPTKCLDTAARNT